MTTIADIQVHKATGSWQLLEKLAVNIINAASSNAKSELKPVLGGATVENGI